MNRFLIVPVLAILLLALPGLSFAEGRHDPTDKNLIFTVLRGSVMSVDPARGALVVAERTVHLIAHEEGDRMLATILEDAWGNPYSLDLLWEGAKVFVRGFEQPNGVVLAREIYALPAGPAQQPFPFEREVPDWKWTEKTKDRRG